MAVLAMYCEYAQRERTRRGKRRATIIIIITVVAIVVIISTIEIITIIANEYSVKEIINENYLNEKVFLCRN